MDNPNITNSGGDLMATYTVQYNGLVGQVKAYNQLSAAAQMKWVQEHFQCFCDSCRTGLANLYSVSFTQIPLFYFTPAHKESN